MGEESYVAGDRGRKLLSAGGNEMNVAAILKLKGSGVVTTTKDKSLLDIAKLLEQHGIGASRGDAERTTPTRTALQPSLAVR